MLLLLKHMYSVSILSNEQVKLCSYKLVLIVIEVIETNYNYIIAYGWLMINMFMYVNVKLLYVSNNR